MFIIVIGPIDHWWNENWGTREHGVYKRWRDRVCRELVEAGHLVYRPHEAFKGAWDERGQEINDVAIARADVMVNVRPPGVPAYGTEAEVNEFLASHEQPWTMPGEVHYYEAPPGDMSQIEHLIIPLDDPYGKVHRKSYTRRTPA